MVEQLYQKHKNCNLVIRRKKVSYKDTPASAIFCKDHNVFLDWISDDLANELMIYYGVPREDWKPSARQQKKIDRRAQQQKTQSTS